MPFRRGWISLAKLLANTFNSVGSGAGLSYEVIRFSARHLANRWCRMLIAPGLWLQRITTKEPDDKQLEVAIVALREALLFDAVDSEQAAVA